MSEGNSNTNTTNADANTYPDIFIGIVSLVGTDIEAVISALKLAFTEFDYNVHHIKISSLFKNINNILVTPFLDKAEKEKRKRIENYIKFGNKVREEKESNDFLARIAISEILNKRGDKPIYHRNVYIIDQLKTVEEIKLLKSVYGKAFFQISIYSARDKRVTYLAKLKAKAENKRDGTTFRDEAEALVNTDYNEKDKPYGQKVGKIFQLADIIISADNVEEHPIKQQVERFVELLFGSNKYSPNRMEYGMYMAHSAALRSLDLSRQVGAAVFRETGEIAVLGCNEVPKAGGGTYWADETYDAREYKRGGDNNDRRKIQLLNEILHILDKDIGDVTSDKKKKLEDSQFMDALEYGRIVHAEMNAVTDAARLGISLKGASLYCTTFPCHMCAKHIIAAGLKQVIFLEPYPKSLTADMHSDSAKVEGASRKGYEEYPAAHFIHFYGITANRYAEFFTRGKRKDNGVFQEYKASEQAPIFAPYEIDREAEIKTARKFIKKLPLTAESVGAVTESSEILLRRARFWQEVRAGRRPHGRKRNR
ncbi:anti-phage dCTP deaminase [Candidatus Tokpelaia sp.]|uniref:anti-phage dCTP deaminase n=1 Tax=Candidatus Tokpelaia sp. TaxID=2233777 RepID=UPI001681750B|nr:anti-phage dCTP deaminase [Candidatus Tokpelaia sp.]